MTPTEQRYGPQTAQVEALLERAARLSPGQKDCMDRAVIDTRGELDVAYYSCLEAIFENDLRIQDGAVSSAVMRIVSSEGLIGVGDAVIALIARHLADSGSFTWEHYRAMTLPWREAVGQVHPDDPAVGGQS
jgi:hypothetical protein